MPTSLIFVNAEADNKGGRRAAISVLKDVPESALDASVQLKLAKGETAVQPEALDAKLDAPAGSGVVVRETDHEGAPQSATITYANLADALVGDPTALATLRAAIGATGGTASPAPDVSGTVATLDALNALNDATAYALGDVVQVADLGWGEAGNFMLVDSAEAAYAALAHADGFLVRVPGWGLGELTDEAVILTSTSSSTHTLGTGGPVADAELRFGADAGGRDYTVPSWGLHKEHKGSSGEQPYLDLATGLIRQDGRVQKGLVKLRDHASGTITARFRPVTTSLRWVYWPSVETRAISFERGTVTYTVGPGGKVTAQGTPRMRQTAVVDVRLAGVEVEADRAGRADYALAKGLDQCARLMTLQHACRRWHETFGASEGVDLCAVGVPGDVVVWGNVKAVRGSGIVGTGDSYVVEEVSLNDLLGTAHTRTVRRRGALVCPAVTGDEDPADPTNEALLWWVRHQELLPADPLHIPSPHWSLFLYNHEFNIGGGSANATPEFADFEWFGNIGDPDVPKSQNRNGRAFDRPYFAPPSGQETGRVQDTPSHHGFAFGSDLVQGWGEGGSDLVSPYLHECSAHGLATNGLLTGTDGDMPGGLNVGGTTLGFHTKNILRNHGGYGAGVLENIATTIAGYNWASAYTNYTVDSYDLWFGNIVGNPRYDFGELFDLRATSARTGFYQGRHARIIGLMADGTAKTTHVIAPLRNGDDVDIRFFSTLVGPNGNSHLFTGFSGTSEDPRFNGVPERMYLSDGHHRIAGAAARSYGVDVYGDFTGQHTLNRVEVSYEGTVDNAKSLSPLVPGRSTITAVARLIDLAYRSDVSTIGKNDAAAGRSGVLIVEGDASDLGGAYGLGNGPGDGVVTTILRRGLAWAPSSTTTGSFLATVNRLGFKAGRSVTIGGRPVYATGSHTVTAAEITAGQADVATGAALRAESDACVTATVGGVAVGGLVSLRADASAFAADVDGEPVRWPLVGGVTLRIPTATLAAGDVVEWSYRATEDDVALDAGGAVEVAAGPVNLPAVLDTRVDIPLGSWALFLDDTTQDHGHFHPDPDTLAVYTIQGVTGPLSADVTRDGQDGIYGLGDVETVAPRAAVLRLAPTGTGPATITLRAANPTDPAQFVERTLTLDVVLVPPTLDAATFTDEAAIDQAAPFDFYETEVWTVNGAATLAETAEILVAPASGAFVRPAGHVPAAVTDGAFSLTFAATADAATVRLRLTGLGGTVDQDYAVANAYPLLGADGGGDYPDGTAVQGRSFDEGALEWLPFSSASFQTAYGIPGLITVGTGGIAFSLDGVTPNALPRRVDVVAVKDGNRSVGFSMTGATEGDQALKMIVAKFSKKFSGNQLTRQSDNPGIPRLFRATIEDLGDGTFNAAYSAQDSGEDSWVRGTDTAVAKGQGVFANLYRTGGNNGSGYVSRLRVW